MILTPPWRDVNAAAATPRRRGCRRRRRAAPAASRSACRHRPTTPGAASRFSAGSPADSAEAACESLHKALLRKRGRVHALGGMTGRSSRGGCCIDMQSSRWCIGYDRAANDARPRWINARRPAVRRSSSGLHDALAECSRSDIMGGCCATYCCATPLGTSVLSPRQDVVR